MIQERIVMNHQRYAILRSLVSNIDANGTVKSALNKLLFTRDDAIRVNVSGRFLVVSDALSRPVFVKLNAFKKFFSGLNINSFDDLFIFPSTYR